MYCQNQLVITYKRSEVKSKSCPGKRNRGEEEENASNFLAIGIDVVTAEKRTGLFVERLQKIKESMEHSSGK